MVDSRSSGPLPDFLIVGAMKCGTTTLYNRLRLHEEVYIPPLEVGFFDIDDIVQHPDFFAETDDSWHYHPLEDSWSELLGWYGSLFADAAPGQTVGERSTSYMASDVAASRIHRVLPDAKLIFMLRDPVARAYSNYWHLLRSGEVACGFGRALRYHTPVLFERGLYRKQIERFLEFFPRSRMLFVLFEEYVGNLEEESNRICEFLEIEPGGREEGRTMHKNRGRYPWSRRLQYAANAILFRGMLDGQRYIDSHLPALQGDRLGHGRLRSVWTTGLTVLNKAVSRINCSRRDRPRLDRQTRDLLKYLYETRNEGLSDLIGRDLREVWSVTKV